MVRTHDIMTTHLLTVSPEATLRELAELLSGEHVSGVPVVAGRQVVGIVSVSDLLDFLSSSPGVPSARDKKVEWGEWMEPEAWEAGRDAPSSYFVSYWENAGAEMLERFRVTDAPEWNLLEEHCVSEIMSRTVLSLSPEAEAREAARMMLEAGVHRILVMDEGRLAGVVTTTDLVEAVSQHGLEG